MTREQQLVFCKQCNHKCFDLQKGIICSLTGDIADFESDCPHFTGDRSQLKFPQPKPLDSKDIKYNPKVEANLFKDVWEFLSQGTPGLSIIIIAISYLYFVIMVGMSNGMGNLEMANVVGFGANLRTYTLDGQPWRLFTTLLVHVNLMHIVMEMIVLLMLGFVIEPLISRKRFIYTMLIAGVMTGLINISIYLDSYNMGLSLSNMGLVGLYLFLFLVDKKLRRPTKKTIISVMIILLVILQFYLTDAFANIVYWIALLIGVFSALTFYLFDKFKQYRIFTLLGHFSLVIVMCLISYLYVATTSTQPDRYLKLMTEFSIAEEKALAVYRLPMGTSYETRLHKVQNEGISNWKICLEKLKDIDKLDELNPYFDKKNQLMKEYCRMRIKSYRILAKAYESETSEYDDKIRESTNDINLQMNKIRLLDEMINSEAYTVNGIKSPYLYIINNNIVSNLSRLNIDKVARVEWINDRCSIKQITTKDVQGIIKITYKGVNDESKISPVSVYPMFHNNSNNNKSVKKISPQDIQKLIKLKYKAGKPTLEVKKEKTEEV